MTDATMGQMTRSGAQASAAWRAAVPGVVFVATFVAAFFLINIPNDTDPDKTWVSWFATRSNRIQLLLSAYLFLVAAIALVVFLVQTMRRILAGGIDPLLLVAIGAAGILFAAGGLLGASVAGATIFGSQPVPTSAELLRFSNNIEFPLILVGGPIPLGLAIALITRHGHRTGYFGRAMTVFGYVALAGSVAAVVFFPMAVALIWVLTVSVILVRRPAPTLR